VLPANATTAMTMRRTSQGVTIAATAAAMANQATSPPNAATATAALTIQLKEVTSAFIMAPFLCDAIFNEKSSNPLELIIIAWEATIEFDAHHHGAASFAKRLQLLMQTLLQTGPLRSIQENKRRYDSPSTPTTMSSRLIYHQDTPIAFCHHLEQQDSSHTEL
jgi:hypothetical protein